MKYLYRAFGFACNGGVPRMWDFLAKPGKVLDKPQTAGHST